MESESPAMPMNTRRSGKANSSNYGAKRFGPHAPSALSVQNFLDLMAKHGIPDEVDLVLPDPGQSPEIVRQGFCCAYMHYFTSCELKFPIPSVLFEMMPNFIRHIIRFTVLAREEGVALSVPDLLWICDVKPNSVARGTYYISPCPILGVLDGVSIRDDKWKEKYFCFKIISESVGRRVWVSTNWGSGDGLKQKKEPTDDRLCRLVA
ncbi:unnamed protein product [Arabis nemorensis]|uniref:Uncharacterized protein n=1 Tax=Arabis nemorensis TaxID=586526 RepID=A0A565C425_9BRAS|nr:unnamed protein product [Arabis nemorensis]